MTSSPRHQQPTASSDTTADTEGLALAELAYAVDPNGVSLILSDEATLRCPRCRRRSLRTIEAVGELRCDACGARRNRRWLVAEIVRDPRALARLSEWRTLDERAVPA